MINTVKHAREVIRSMTSHQPDPSAYVEYADISRMMTDVLRCRAANDGCILTANANAIIFFARIDAFYNQTNYRENIERALDYENFDFVDCSTPALFERIAELVWLIENVYFYNDSLNILSVICDELIQMLFADILNYFKIGSKR